MSLAKYKLMLQGLTINISLHKIMVKRLGLQRLKGYQAEFFIIDFEKKISQKFQFYLDFGMSKIELT